MGPFELQATLMRIAFTRPLGALMLSVMEALIWMQRPDIVDFHNRVQDIPAQFIYDVYDFIVVGGGTAGSAVAARLSEVCDWDVLLLEAGPDETYISEIPYAYPTLQKSKLDWQFVTEPNEHFCRAMEDNRCAWPRGKVLGGSSVLNAIMYVRGNQEDFNEWASFGNVGWSWDDVLPYFVKLENVRDPKISGKPWHGTHGPISVEIFRNRSRLHSYFANAVKDMGLKYEDEVNGPSQVVFAPTHGTVRDGLRCSAAKGYLRPVAMRKNLHISLNTFVEKVLIDPTQKRAYGVMFNKDGQRRYVLATKEVILSAGSLNSPHLLMLSGVGPKEQLEEHDIEVIHDSPGVGKNLQDHTATGGSVWLITNPNNTGYLSVTIWDAIRAETLKEFLFNKTGMLYNMASCEVMGFINTKYNPPNSTRPDVQLFLTSQTDVSDGGMYAAYGAHFTYKYYAENFENWVFRDTYICMPLLMRPQSRGYLKLKSKNPYEKIAIFPNFFTVRRDVEILMEGLKFCNEMAKQPSLASLNPTLIYDKEPDSTCGTLKDDESLECQVRAYSQTIYHPVGTSKMGPKSDPLAVVDPRLKVHGIDGLRVVDAGIMPTITTGNTNVPTYMIGEKAADMIKADYLPFLLKEPKLKPCNTYQYKYH